MKSIILTLLAIYTAFLSGLGMFYVYNKYYAVKPLPCSQSCPDTKNPIPPQKTLDLEDLDILLVTNEQPKKIFHLNHINHNAADYQVAYLSYSLDGTALDTKTIPYESIKWEQVTINGNNLEYKISGKFNVDGSDVTFEIPSINLNMVIRAQQYGGKYGGSTPHPITTITYNNSQINAYAAVTAGFFTAYPLVDMQALHIKTNWIMYFDKDFNFYHLDVTNVQNPTPDYYSHSFMSQALNTGYNVEYFNSINISSTDSRNLSLIYSNDFGEHSKEFTKSSDVKPYKHALMSIIREESGGIGIYTNLDSSR